MEIKISVIVSVLALLATFYQLRLQRVHNEKSLKPLGQITLSDHDKTITVRLYNNGLGPLIIDRLTFNKGGEMYSSLKDCVDLEPRSFIHFAMDDLVEKVVLPGSYLTVFEKSFTDQTDDASVDQIKEAMDRIRLDLSPITLKVKCRDIYDNEITVERSCKWFARHILKSVNNQL